MLAGDGSGGERWKALGERELADCGIFRVRERRSEGPDGRRGRFVFLDAADWAAVVPLVETPEGPAFLMVRQYRHGSDEASLEFPGGVIEAGEDPAAAAARELEEETGYRAGRLRAAGTISPNPAIMANDFHVFLADRLEPTGRRSLDEHEIVDALLVPVAEVRAKMGRGEYRHALMAAALFLADRLLAEGEGTRAESTRPESPRAGPA
ncbi:MAG: NUDIX hydrolase [Spirochaetaceae bacterium]|nr:NUDIX hydrolase [Spirochaetaceae bacterium]